VIGSLGHWVTESVGCSIGLMSGASGQVGSQSRFGRGVVSGCTENQVRSQRLGVKSGRVGLGVSEQMSGVSWLGARCDSGAV
jgi:hypothetical protein